jgi:hypothetical protein
MSPLARMFGAMISGFAAGRGDCRRDRLRSHDVDVAAQGSRARHGRTAERACAGARALVEAQRVR